MTRLEIATRIYCAMLASPRSPTIIDPQFVFEKADSLIAVDKATTKRAEKPVPHEFH